MPMNKKFTEPFSNAFLNVMPQLGMSDAKLLREEECDRKINTPGVVVIIGITGDVHGNVIFALSEDSAKKIASTMMGMPVEEFDDMAQSAVGELGNMLAASACTDFAGMGIKADISTPTLMYGVFNASASFDHVFHIELVADEMPFDIYVAIEQK
jgi:chemotaxis protein CheX